MKYGKDEGSQDLQIGKVCSFQPVPNMAYKLTNLAAYYLCCAFHGWPGVQKGQSLDFSWNTSVYLHTFCRSLLLP